MGAVMSLVYIEYFRQRFGVELREFHASILKGLEGWDANFAQDRLIIMAARTWRLGPQPEYLAAWYSPAAGFERIDQWEQILRSGGGDAYELTVQRVANITSAGCYEPLVEPLAVRNGIHYAEFFRVRSNIVSVRNLYQRRLEHHPRLKLSLLGHRIGQLGPDPGGVPFLGLA